MWNVPAVTKTLANGLKVVVSEDHSAPTFGVCVSYGIGFRLEPEGRTGFAHLFEHMMFEGTPNAPKGTLDAVIEGGGGNNNGDTRYDFTEYIETAPVSALDPILWIEADRMKTLDFSPGNLENQRKVVEEEVRVNVLNQPYGLFFAIDLPGKAFDTYPNSHNFYGDFKDLDAAKIGDVRLSTSSIIRRITRFSRSWRCKSGRGIRQSREVFRLHSGAPHAAPGKTEEAPQTAERISSRPTNWRTSPPLPSAIECPPAVRATRSSGPLPASCCITGRPRGFIRPGQGQAEGRSLWMAA